MKNRSPAPVYEPAEHEIRDLALELYIRSGWLPGRDLDNWLEAEAYLRMRGPLPDEPMAAAPAPAPNHGHAAALFAAKPHG